MTQDEIIRMAREAGIEFDLIDEDEGQIWYITSEGLERFAALVAAAERDECACLCDALERTKVYGAKECAEGIRARGRA